MSNPREFVATLCRGRKKEVVWTRRYVRIDTALPRGVELLLWAGEPGDVIEIAHHTLGVQLATMKLSVGGKLAIDWSPMYAAQRDIEKAS